MADDRIRVVIEGDSSDLVREARAAGAAIKNVSRDAARESGRYVDAQGRMREANGRFVAGYAADSTRLVRSGGAVNAVLERQQQNLQGVTRLAGYATVALGGLATVGVAKFVKDGLQFNATMESNEVALERFVGKGEKTKAFLNDLFETAKKTPFQFTDLTMASRRLLAFGLDVKKTKGILDALGDGLAAMGGGAEQIERVTMAIGQIQAKGRVQAEELLQIAEAGIPVYQILQEELGLSLEQVRNIGEEAIPADQAIAALTRGMNKRFAGAAAEQSKTFDGMMSTLKDNWAQTTGAMTRGLFEDLKRWTPAVNTTMEDIAAIWKREDLSVDEKIQASIDSAKLNLGPIVDELEGMLDDANLGKAFGDALEVALPVIAKAGGRAGLEFLKGFVNSWSETDTLGKLFMAGVFVRYLGGMGLITATGRWIGLGLGAGVAEGAAAGAAGGAGAGAAGVAGGAGARAGIAGGIMGSLKAVKWGRVGAIGIGLALAESVMEGVQLNMDKSGGSLMDSVTAQTKASVGDISLPISVHEGRLTELTGWDPFGSGKAQEAKDFKEQLDAVQESATGITREFRLQIAAQARSVDLSAEQKEELDQLLDSAEARREKFEGLAKVSDISIGVGKWDAQLRRMAGLTDRRMKQIREAFRTNPEQGRAALAAAMDKGVQSIRRAMDAGKIATDEGMGQIAFLMREKLKLFGVTGAGADKYISMNTPGGIDNHPGKTSKGRPEPTSGKQRGGPAGLAATVPGVGAGDRHLLSLNGEPIALVESQEGIFVGNRNLMGALTKANQDVPRFKTGGVAKDTNLPRATGNFPLGWAPAGAVNSSAIRGEEILESAKNAQAKKKAAKASAGGVGGYTGPPANMAQLGNAAWVDAHTLAVGNYIANRFGLSFSSTWRSISHNAAVGGVPGSLHTHGSLANPGAIDFSPASTAALAFAQKHVAGLAEAMNHDVGSGLHLHLGFFRQGGVVVPARPMHGQKWVKGSAADSDRGRLWSEDEWATLLWQVGAQVSEAELASTKLMGESGGNPKAHGPPDGRGLGQIEKQFHPELAHLNLFQPIPNAVATLHVLRKQGIGAWYGKSGAAGKVRPEWVEGETKPTREPRSAKKKGKTGGDATAESNTDAIKEIWEGMGLSLARGAVTQQLAGAFGLNAYPVAGSISYGGEQGLLGANLAILAGIAAGLGTNPFTASPATSAGSGSGISAAAIKKAGNGLGGKVKGKQPKREKGTKTGGVAPPKSAARMLSLQAQKAVERNKKNGKLDATAKLGTGKKKGKGNHIVNPADWAAITLAASAAWGDAAADPLALINEMTASTQGTLNLSRHQQGIFDSFEVPYVGAFKRGGRVRRDGLGYLHKDETVTPAPTGAAATAPATNSQGPTTVTLIIDSDLGPLMRNVTAVVDNRVAKVDRRVGRQSRRMAAAPGG